MKRFAAAGAAVLTASVAARAQRDGSPGALHFRLEKVELEVNGLHEAHDGLTLVQLSDIHVGPRTPDRRILAAIDAVNAIRPDLVILTGDYVTRKGDPLERVPELFSRLQVPAIATLGNHDHWVDAFTLRRGLEGINIPVLRNEHTVVQVRGAPLGVVGIDDGVTGRADPIRALKGSATLHSRIVLAHAPPTVDTLPPGENLVVFSGHTHGGQFYFGGVTDEVFRRAGQPYVRGLYRKGGNQLYVNRGLGFGTGGTLPRVNSDPEVTLVTLRRG